MSELRAELVSSAGMAAIHHRGRSFLHAAPVSQLARGILSSGPDQAINRSLMSMLLTPAEAAALLPPLEDEEMSLLTRQDEEVISAGGLGVTPANHPFIFVRLCPCIHASDSGTVALVVPSAPHSLPNPRPQAPMSSNPPASRSHVSLHGV